MYHTYICIVCKAILIDVVFYITYIAQSGNNTLQVIITSDPPVNDNTLCVNETVLLTCQVSDAAQPTYKWSSPELNISDHIVVV